MDVEASDDTADSYPAIPAGGAGEERPRHRCCQNQPKRQQKAAKHRLVARHVRQLARRGVVPAKDQDPQDQNPEVKGTAAPEGGAAGRSSEDRDQSRRRSVAHGANRIARLAAPVDVGRGLDVSPTTEDAANVRAARATSSTQLVVVEAGQNRRRIELHPDPGHWIAEASN